MYFVILCFGYLAFLIMVAWLLNMALEAWVDAIDRSFPPIASNYYGGRYLARLCEGIRLWAVNLWSDWVHRAH